ncbi:chemotaxis response regulator protein-glutamate methylesterase [Rheinheimera baltica]|uniref:Protein-glutamate methylesterase/protein-glutamine glutaminase n=1 Tax=Rheinheimera baltica TaxID=67576 RepID=A0ABT9I3E4_9GAMM|nr:chemotaxis response regulator protein-glutamate methylesterase [Rheinheimera baltica]MDP5137902.1 chemotaxis response regulator protein-glutamate methylesterase [Rheinheimera baltica]
MIKVLVVDDSALIRSLLSEIVRSEPEFMLVGAASDAYVARDLVNLHRPDVITLDVEMPKVDGLTFLEKLMKARPTAVVMISSLTEQGADVTLRALELGAVDFLAKPKLDIARGIEEYRLDIVAKIKAAALAKLSGVAKCQPKKTASLRFKTTEKIIAIGASTGGTEAIKAVLTEMPVDSPGIVITQHMPPGFTSSFARRLDGACRIKVLEAQGGERIVPGHAYLAPGDKHLTVVRSGADYRIELTDGPRVSGHKPSVDVMFQSVAEAVGANALAVILTGMGKDGAVGIRSIAEQGGFTMAQDEASSLIFGMPQEAIKTGCVKQIVSLDEVSLRLIEVLNLMGKDYRI